MPHAFVTVAYYILTDLTITTDKLLKLFASVDEPKKVDALGHTLVLPTYEIDRIKKNYQNPIRRKEAYIDLYVHQHPCPSWKRVASVLRFSYEIHQEAEFVEKTYVEGI